MNSTPVITNGKNVGKFLDDFTFDNLLNHLTPKRTNLNSFWELFFSCKPFFYRDFVLKSTKFLLIFETPIARTNIALKKYDPD